MKHHATKVCRCLECGGPAATFDSKAEYAYYRRELLPQLKRELITDFVVHPTFEIAPGVKVKADFSYVDKDGVKHVIDVKGSKKPLTKQFKRNQKLVEAKFGIRIEVVRYRA